VPAIPVTCRYGHRLCRCLPVVPRSRPPAQIDFAASPGLRRDAIQLPLRESGAWRAGYGCRNIGNKHGLATVHALCAVRGHPRTATWGGPTAAPVKAFLEQDPTALAKFPAHQFTTEAVLSRRRTEISPRLAVRALVENLRYAADRCAAPWSDVGVLRAVSSPILAANDNATTGPTSSSH